MEAQRCRIAVCAKIFLEGRWLDALGIHVMLDLKNCNRELLDDLPYIRGVLIEAADHVGAHILNESFHHFDPHGVTGILAIAESHICIHTWPEHGYAAADIFTCNNSVMPNHAAQVIVSRLESKDPSLVELKRGIALQPASISKPI
jgi:S-adenosylmethionine decarboxylase